MRSETYNNNHIHFIKENTCMKLSEMCIDLMLTNSNFLNLKYTTMSETVLTTTIWISIIYLKQLSKDSNSKSWFKEIAKRFQAMTSE